jgi:hypothetical protein
MKDAPELMPYVQSGELTLAECVRAIRQSRQRPEPELTFDEEVERSFRRWMSKWPKEERKKVRAIVDLMPAEENFAVEMDLETSQGKNGKPRKKQTE